jgi:hypothetical protein
MRSILLQSMMLALLVIPIVAARDPRPLRGHKRGVVWFVAFNQLYMLALRFVYPSLS